MISGSRKKMLFGGGRFAANLGSFDCVRLGPHFAQDDSVHRRKDYDQEMKL